MQYVQVFVFAFVVVALGVSSVSAQTNVTNCTSCDNFANCTSINSTLFTCECQSGYEGNGTTCDVQAEITCSRDPIADGYAMRIKVQKAYFDYHGYTISDLRLLNASCVPVLSGTDYVFEVPFYSSCGTNQTTNSTVFIFSNVISTDGGLATGTVRTIATSCQLGSTLSLGPTIGNNSGLNVVVPPDQSIIFTSVGESELRVTMYLYQNDQYTTPYNGVPVLTTTDMIYAEIQVRPVINFFVVMEECWGTPSSNRDDPNRYDIINSPGCMESGVYDGAVTSNGASDVGRFQLQVFKWITSPSTYLHCVVSLCDSNGNTTCQPTCPTSRRKRDTFSDNHKTISSVFIMRDDRHIKIPDQATTNYERTSSSNTTQWIIVISVSVFFLIVITVLLACLCRKRRTEKPKNISTKVFPPTMAS